MDSVVYIFIFYKLITYQKYVLVCDSKILLII